MQKKKKKFELVYHFYLLTYLVTTVKYFIFSSENLISCGNDFEMIAVSQKKKSLDVHHFGGSVDS